MNANSDRRQRTRASARRRARKDRLIQTRVGEDLESALKLEAAKRRLTVSHLIRNTLEDTFHLVEDVTTDVEQLVSGSVELAAAVGRDARRLASFVRGRGLPRDEDEALDARQRSAPAAPETRPDRPTGGPEASAGVSSAPREAPDPLDHIYGWNRLVANRAAQCARCGGQISRGDDALVGLSDDPSKPRTWLCAACGDTL